MPTEEPSDKAARPPEEPSEQTERPSEDQRTEPEEPAPERRVARVRDGEWGFLALALPRGLALGMDERSR